MRISDWSSDVCSSDLRRDAIDNRRIDDLPLARARSFDQRRENAHHEKSRSAPEVPHQIERRTRWRFIISESSKRPGQRDVIYVMVGGLGERAILAPPCPPTKYQTRVALTQPAGHQPQPL